MSPDNNSVVSSCLRRSRPSVELLIPPREQVDAFTERTFGGNPAAVFFTHNGGDADWMQKVGLEVGGKRRALLARLDETPE